MDQISRREAGKYAKVWADPRYGQSPSPGLTVLPRALEVLGLADKNENGTRSVHFTDPMPSIVDFGCGDGRVVRELRDYGFDAIGVDLDNYGGLPWLSFVQASLWELPLYFTVDYGLCCDVMEHIPTDNVVGALTCMRRVIKKAAFFQIAMFEDYFGPEILGEPLHLTVKDPAWWKAAFTLAGWRTLTTVDGPEGGPQYLLAAARPMENPPVALNVPEDQLFD
jgi:SAM-dependent methyltransferase